MPRTKRPALPGPYADSIKEPPDLPEAVTLRDSGLPLSKPEFDLVRAAMAVHAASRQPKLTWQGWKLIGAAIAVAEKHTRKLAGGQTTGKGYNLQIAVFLRATGFAFLNKGVRWALRQCMARVESIDEWRETLSPNEREHLQNPIDVWDQFNKRDVEHPERPKIRAGSKKHREQVTLLEYCVALEEQIASLKEQLDEAQAALDELRQDARG